jgi:ribosomal subunit interface protein
MNLTVKGKNIDVGEALKAHIQSALENIFDKYFGDAIEASVVVAKQNHLFEVVMSAHVGRGIQLHSEASADQAYGAFDLAAEHLAKRLRRYKSRLRDHRRDVVQSLRAKQYVLAGLSHDQSNEEAAGAESGSAPAIIAEMQTEIPTLSVSEAVMRLDLSDQRAMMFVNSAHGGLNMIYRRGDGNIGWVDPRLGEQSGRDRAAE